MDEWSQTHPLNEYLRYLSEGRFMLPRAKVSGRFFFPPRVAEPGTGDEDLEWAESTGRGAVYSSSVMRQRSPETNYNVALIDLDDGVRLMSRVDGVAPEDVEIGMRVRAKIINAEGEALLVFLPE